DGKPIDIATLLASTDPSIDITTAAGPGGQGGQGTDNSGAIFQQLGGDGGLGGFQGAGAQGGTEGPANGPGPDGPQYARQLFTAAVNNAPTVSDVSEKTDE